MKGPGKDCQLAVFSGRLPSMQAAIDTLGQAFKKLMTAVLDTTPSEATDDIQKRMRSITTLFSNFVTLAIYVFLLVWLFQLVAQIIVRAVVPELQHYDIRGLLRSLESEWIVLLKAIPIVIAAIAYAVAALLYSLQFFLAVSRFIRSYRVFTALGILYVGYSVVTAFGALFDAKSPSDTARLILNVLLHALK
jgi:hypothetical protein